MVSTDRTIYKLENRIFRARRSILGVQVNLLSRHLRILDKGHRKSKAASSFGVVKPVFTSAKLDAIGDDDSGRLMITRNSSSRDGHISQRLAAQFDYVSAGVS